LKFRSIHGVDFSGAKRAGRTIWIAQCVPVSVGAPQHRIGAITPRTAGAGPKHQIGAVIHRTVSAGAQHRGFLRLVALNSLEDLCGAPDRDTALPHLVDLISTSDRAIWGMDFPFGLPIEVVNEGSVWSDQLQLLRSWQHDAYELGLSCLERAKLLGGNWHIRRATDSEAKTPFDCYHYRIIYQTFYGMRDVLAPLARHRGTAILPFHYRRLATARRVILESCPSSTLKRWSTPHQNYKQPAGGPLTSVRRRTRHAILSVLSQYVEMSDAHRRLIMRNGGGDALDAVIAAVGAWQAYRSADHAAIARHPRYRREGYLYT
jgi:hypothetical protein